jgi:hypothetical protein
VPIQYRENPFSGLPSIVLVISKKEHNFNARAHGGPPLKRWYGRAGEVKIADHCVATGALSPDIAHVHCGGPGSHRIRTWRILPGLRNRE